MITLSSSAYLFMLFIQLFIILITLSYSCICVCFPYQVISTVMLNIVLFIFLCLVCARAQLLRCVRLFAILWTIAHQAPLFMVFSSRKTGVACFLFLQGIFLTQGSNPCFLCLPALAGRFFTIASGKLLCLTPTNKE